MMQHCRVCGVWAGGLTTNRYGLADPLQLGWPEVDLCPQCAGQPEPADEMADAIVQAFKDTLEMRKRERAGEVHMVVWRTAAGLSRAHVLVDTAEPADGDEGPWRTLCNRYADERIPAADGAPVCRHCLKALARRGEVNHATV